MRIRRFQLVAVWVFVFAVVVVAVPRYLEVETGKRASRGIVPPTPPVEVLRGTFERNATLSTTLAAFDLSNSMVYEITEAVRPVFNVRQFRPGQDFEVVLDHTGQFLSFEYVIDEESTLKVERVADGFEARREQLPLELHIDTVVAEVDSSLWGALSVYPGGDGLVMELVDVFQSRVDFYRDIRQGDQIRIIIEALYHRGQFVKYGQVLGSELVNRGKSLQAYQYRDEYYDENGMSTRRSFLPAPLEFIRISGNFSVGRLHPILDITRAHRGVDYAAPSGTPVWAAADGTVTYAGTNGSYGRFVRLRHPNGTQTEYAHLSRVLVNVGDRVDQKDVIGRVGMTGLATGNHLHYQLMQDGAYVDPRRARLDPPKPIDPADRDPFMRMAAPLHAQLAALTLSSTTLSAEE
jgi:murein DD-endopeptidase MepM/ murein hydrolase activator NlpD